VDIIAEKPLFVKYCNGHSHLEQLKNLSIMVV
jgi:hypothetical protein